jgi:hypothetical protein
MLDSFATVMNSNPQKNKAEKDKAEKDKGVIKSNLICEERVRDHRRKTLFS